MIQPSAKVTQPTKSDFSIGQALHAPTSIKLGVTSTVNLTHRPESSFAGFRLLHEV